MEKILIVDDSEMNRAVLADILGNGYEIIEAEDGVQALATLQNLHTAIDLVLLDVIMPNMDGFGVLTAMNENHWIDNIPVIMISDDRDAYQIERAYELGATDFIIRPDDALIVRHRIINTLMLYAKQKQLASMIDIHETHMEIEALKWRASRDALTGLLNLTSSRMQAEDRLASDPDSNFMMAIFDLDYFKEINDTYGHQFGNEVLQQIASILNKGLRSGDIASRIGGDEFMIFLECGPAKEQVIRRIFTALSQPYKDYAVSVSMGIATAKDVGPDYEAMFRAADQALYFAKENGHGRYCFYDDSMQNMLLLPHDQINDNI